MSHGFPKRLRKQRDRKSKPTSKPAELPSLRRFSTADLIAEIQSRPQTPVFAGALAEAAAANNQT
jgi:hypothetical protein